MVSIIDAVAIGGRSWDSEGTRKDKFFKLRARRPGESGRTAADAGDNKEWSGGIAGNEAASVGKDGGNWGYDSGMIDGVSGEELGETSPVE